MFLDDQIEKNIDQTIVDAFIDRWSNADGTERSNYQLFLTELCETLNVEKPKPSGQDNTENIYVFERSVDINKTDGSVSKGFIDLYKKGCFVLEAKQTKKNLETSGWDKAMLAAQNQADNYVRSLPAEEGRPPFIVVTDVGRSIELYSEFSCSGGTYVPFPDPRNHRIKLEDLRNPEIQQRIIKLWERPEALDPSKYSARVTREISSKLAKLAKSLEGEGFEVERVAHFLKRSLFSMFCEDVGLLPKDSFTQFLIQQKDDPKHFPDAIKSLWETMNTGGYSPILNESLKKFNGGLFQDIEPIPLKAEQIELLIEAGKADWRYVEPAIFGTLLERALDPRERHKLGAHYTPREYVERLVMPTIIEPLRKEWKDIQVVAETWLQKGKTDKAVDELKKFHMKLCETKVLDPACGSANFLYVSLEHMKRLEGEVLNLISDLSGGQDSLSADQLTVDPHQFLGIEINPRAAAIAEIVLWIGYLQWHFRINGRLDLPEPILRDFHNIECRDALMDYDSREPMKDEDGNPITIWDGISYKPSPVTGELIPDDSQRIQVYHYINPTKAKWPQADYIVGNPPYIGARRIRQALGEGYLNAIRTTYEEIPENSDFVMYWFAIAAEIVGKKESKNFGLITTNSIKQSFCRKVVDSSLEQFEELKIMFVVPDHPWVDSSNGAAVRVTLITMGTDVKDGRVLTVTSEKSIGNDGYEIKFDKKIGYVTANLSIGADPGKAKILESNNGMSCVGYQLTGKGFIIEPEEIKSFSSESRNLLIKPLISGRDITQKPRSLLAIDTFGLNEVELNNQYPDIYQWLADRLKAHREKNRDSASSKWWLYARPRAEFRPALQKIDTVAVTSLTAKHRIFVNFDSTTIADSTTVIFAVEKPEIGVLSSRIHITWALAAGGRLGVGNDSRYNKTRCFETFPFPVLDDTHKKTIGELAEKIDQHRKQQQIQHEGLTLTNIYNVLEKLRSGDTLTKKEQEVHQQGLVSVLKELHDELDKAVFDAYGWSDLGEILVGLPGATTPLPDKSEQQAQAEEELLMRLVDLNQKRAAEEAKGLVRWLRPEYQAPNQEQANVDLEADEEEIPAIVEVSDKAKPSWPKDLPQQVHMVKSALEQTSHSLESLSAQFKRKPTKSVQQVLAALEMLGQAKLEGDVWRLQ